MTKLGNQQKAGARALDKQSTPRRDLVSLQLVQVDEPLFGARIYVGCSNKDSDLLGAGSQRLELMTSRKGLPLFTTHPEDGQCRRLASPGEGSASLSWVAAECINRPGGGGKGTRQTATRDGYPYLVKP